MSKYVIKHGTFIEVSEDTLRHRNYKYVDLAPGELMHWKYVKRVKLPGGGYRYYYDESAAKADENQATYDTKRKLKEAQRESFKAGQEHYQAKAAFDAAGLNDGRRVFYNNEARLYEANKNAEKKAKRAEKVFETAYAKYKFSKLGVDIQKAASKGIVKVANFFANLGKKKKKN